MTASLRLAAGDPARTGVKRLFGVDPLPRRAAEVFRAALAELAVAEALAGLGASWDVLHGVPVGPAGSVVDHLAIGPSGVYAIASLQAGGEDVAVATSALAVGRRRPALPTVAGAAAEVSRLLSAAGTPVRVTAVVAVVGARALRGGGTPNQFVVLRDRQLVTWLLNRPRRLPGDDVARISALAERAEMWAAPPPPRADCSRLPAEFARLRRQVMTARRRRLLWSAAGAGLLAAAGWGTIALLS